MSKKEIITFEKIQDMVIDGDMKIEATFPVQDLTGDGETIVQDKDRLKQK